MTGFDHMTLGYRLLDGRRVAWEATKGDGTIWSLRGHCTKVVARESTNPVVSTFPIDGEARFVDS
jgi:hypothetical protein